MADWVAKRFWQKATVTPAPGGHTVLLDARPIRTPAKAPLILPTPALAAAIAAEWDAQTGTINPATMPNTRSANAAIDKVMPQHAEVAGLLAAYGAHDHLCYRAPGPQALIDRQAFGWNPLLEWAAEHLKAPLATGPGVVPVAQDKAVLARLAARVAAIDAFGLAALHDLVSLSGSLILAFAVTEAQTPPEAAWDLSRIDETWQAEQWGDDADAAQAAAIKREAFLHAARFWELSRR